MHDGSCTKRSERELSACTHKHRHAQKCAESGKGTSKCGGNGRHRTGVGYKYINNNTTSQTGQHSITVKSGGLISHTQLVHLVNVKRAVIVNYIPI